MNYSEILKDVCWTVFIDIYQRLIPYIKIKKIIFRSFKKKKTIIGFTTKYTFSHSTLKFNI